MLPTKIQTKNKPHSADYVALRYFKKFFAKKSAKLMPILENNVFLQNTNKQRAATCLGSLKRPLGQ